MTLTHTEDLKTGIIPELERFLTILPSELEAVARDLISPCSMDEWEDKAGRLSKTLAIRGDKECPFPYRHVFSDGVYYREVTKGPLEIVIGQRHKREHANIVLQGRQVVFTNDGPFLAQGPTSFVGLAGSRKITLTLTPVVFANVFPNEDNCRDVKELERRLVEEDELNLEEVTA